MRRLLIIAALVTAAVSGFAKPNIVFVLADDLGYGDVGPFGQTRIQTPNLDKLAAQGMRLTQHYAGNAVCAPSRCVFMTGKHPGHAWIRNNREVQPEGQPPIRTEEVTIAEVLKGLGYVSAAIGKWGLGYPGSEGEPLKQGFDRFYGYNCQRHAHNHYPTYLWDNDRRVTLNNPDFTAHQALPWDADPADRAVYERYIGKEYAPDLMLEQAVRFVQENKSKPFFLYFASTIPHLALQAPPEAVNAYFGKWKDPPYTGTNSYLPHFRPRAAYAAMISRLDEHVGKLVSVIDKLGLTTNTIFVFTSDNGPLYGHLGGTDCEFFESARNLRGRKGSLYEGGVRVPLIVRWTGRIKAGSVSDRVTGFEDWLPTFLELANIATKPADIDGISFAPTLLGRMQPARAFLYREFPAYGGQQSIRVGEWKVVRQNLSAKTKTKTELYNLKDDPTEGTDVSAKKPEVLGRLTDLMRAQHVKSGMFPLPGVD
ncbi:MAG TPA: arylsulfatase [Pyrinomonadaceae bacterium]|nr:arylsulfatase [Pyrinomonadaceae bacterium]